MPTGPRAPRALRQVPVRALRRWRSSRGAEVGACLSVGRCMSSSVCTRSCTSVWPRCVRRARRPHPALGALRGHEASDHSTVKKSLPNGHSLSVSSGQDCLLLLPRNPPASSVGSTVKRVTRAGGRGGRRKSSRARLKSGRRPTGGRRGPPRDRRSSARRRASRSPQRRRAATAAARRARRTARGCPPCRRAPVRAGAAAPAGPLVSQRKGDAWLEHGSRTARAAPITGPPQHTRQAGRRD